MSGTDWLVVGAGVAAIAWVNWYFFLAQRATAAAMAAPQILQRAGGAASSDASAGIPSSAASATPEVTITVKGGYSPSAIRVKAGRPVRLLFDRQDTSGCSEEVVFPDFGIRRFLPTGRTTTIEVTPPAAGRYEFMCGMSMLRGTLIAEE